jgi:uncharacterized repeat protein (TIGR02543 family)
MKRLLTFFSVVALFLACSKDTESPAPQPKPKFTITVTAGEGGSVSSTGGSYEQGSTVSVTATASSGYRFTGWSNGETSATLNITVTGNLSVTALFEKIAYSVDISGAVSKGAFLTGSTLTFYELNNSLSQTGKSYNTDITDNFGTYSLSVEELTEDYARVVGEGFYWNEVTNTNTEEKLSLNAISEVKEGININVLTHLEYQRVIELVKNQGKSFTDAKKQALTETLSSLGIETTADYGTSEQFNFKEGDEKSKILVVVSAIIQAERSSAEVTELITTIANDLKDNGNIDNTEVKSDVAVGIESLDLNVIASNIYDRYKEQNPELTQDNFTSNYLEIAKTEYQEFLPDQDNDGVWDGLDTCPDTPEGEEADENGCGKTQKQYQLTTTIEGEGSISEEIIQQTTASYDYGTTVRLTANPSIGWEFKEWTGDITSTENPVDVTVVEEVSVTAVFVRKQFTITTTIEGEGGVSVSPEAESFEYESIVELTATPSEGWVFSEWKGAVNSSENPLSISIDESKEITAVFKRKQYDLSITVEGEGTVAEEIVVQPSQYEYETQVKLTASSSEGWEFTGWSGDLEGSENPTTITVDKEKAVTATFEKADSDGDGVVDLEDLCPDTPEGATVNANGCHDFIYIAENGVTIKAKETAIIGDMQELNGETYKVVDETMLREMVTNDEDVSKVVTTNVTNMNLLFNEKTTFNQDISSWDISNVTNMRSMFRAASSFNQDISLWDVSRVVTMHEMFGYAESFNQDISSWNIGAVTDFERMFSGAKAFNQDISSWNMTNATSLNYMFTDAQDFNQDLNQWDVSNVKSMAWTFSGATSFNGNISFWDTSVVETMSHMFGAADSFNQDISDWDTSAVITMERMFSDANTFNIDISSWEVFSVVNMDHMFYEANAFNQDLSNWCVTEITENPDGFNQASGLSDENLPIWGQCGEIELGTNGITIIANDNAVVGESYRLSNDGDSYKVVDESMLREMVANDEDMTKVVTTRVTNMNNLFKEKASFNQDIGYWDTSNVTSMSYMFWQSGFNQDISYWDVSKVIDMGGLFRASPFNQDISDWNVINVQSMSQMFMGTVFTGDISSWNTSSLTNLDGTFYNSQFNGSLSGWDVSNVTDMNATFHSSRFNQDLNNWDTGKVTRMTSMFKAALFNQPLNNWDTSSVTNMNAMFDDAYNFNQNLNDWDTSKVTDMKEMFKTAPEFNGNISAWNTGSVTTMEDMFAGAQQFNQDIGSWDVSSIQNMDRMFLLASSFNQDLSSWCVSEITEKPNSFNEESGLSDENLPIWGQCGEIEFAANGVTIVANENAVVGESYKLSNDGDPYLVVDQALLIEMNSNREDVSHVVTTLLTNMEGMFNEKEIFNDDISSWDVSNVTNMRAMFYKARSFNADISKWDVSNVTDMELMFRGAELFNQPIGSWNMSSVEKVQNMFRDAISFDQDISNWDMSNKTWIGGMFYGATSFNQPLNNWDVSNISDFSSMFKDATSFNQPLDNWDVQNAGNNGGLDYMFNGAQSFNQDISMWCVSNIIDTPQFFSNDYLQEDYVPIWGTCPLVDDDDSDGVVNYYDECPDSSSGDFVDDKGCVIPPIYIDENGVTVKAREFATVGQTYELNGLSYLIVDNDILGKRVDETLNSVLLDEDNNTRVCTSFVTDLNSVLMKNGEIGFFNEDIGDWDVSNVTNMYNFLANIVDFNQDISYWDVGSVTNFHGAFSGAKSFNQPIGGWDTSNATDISRMFYMAESFNQPIGEWQLSKVTTMKGTFEKAKKFNQDISNWDTSNVETMENMFWVAREFNKDISNWDTSKVINMRAMFYLASKFDQNLINWNVGNVYECSNFRTLSALSVMPTFIYCDPN